MTYEYEDAHYDDGYRDGMQRMREVGHARIEELEAKLAKAVAALQDIFEKPRSADWTYAKLISEMKKEARATLTEIKGENK